MIFDRTSRIKDELLIGWAMGKQYWGRACFEIVLSPFPISDRMTDQSLTSTQSKQSKSNHRHWQLRKSWNLKKITGLPNPFQFSIFVSRVQNEKYHFWTLAKSRSKFESNQRQLRGPSTSQQINRNRDENVIDQPHHRLRRDDGWRQQWGKISFPATIDTARWWHIWYSHCVETSPIAPVGWLSILGSLLVGLCS